MLRAPTKVAPVSPAKARRWTELLIDSDRQYFSAGAVSQRSAGAELVVLPGLAQHAAGAVAFIDDALPVLFRPRAWRDTMVALCRAEGASSVRIYTHASDSRLTAALDAAGFTACVEVAMAGYAERIAADDCDTSVSIREVTNASGWETKRRLHERTPERPDGKDIDADSWVRLERNKVDARYMTAWLIERNGEPCGAFGLSFRRDMVRFKNVFVLPEHRRRGVATSAVRLMGKLARARGYPALGCFVLPDADSAAVYERAGLARVGTQIEWTLPLAQSVTHHQARTGDAVG